MGATDPIIKVQSIYTRFGTVTVHEDVSFEVAPGTIVGIIGGSGTGKSVMMREILGLERPHQGTIEVLGKDVWHLEEDELSELRTHFGVLFQDGALFSGLTVRENIAVPLIEQLKLPNELLYPIVTSRLLMSGLTASAGEKMPSELSGGMVKRAAIARALALEPEILFLDEPTSGLDPINARGIDQLIRSLADNLGLTVMVVTHDVLTLKSVVDKIIVLLERKKIAEGSYDEIVKSSHPWIHEYFERM